MRSPAQARMGERQARFEAVYAAYRTPVLGYALRRTLSPDDAADILAETFLVAFTFPSQDGVTAILVNERLLNAGTIQYEGYVRDGQQTLVLNQTPVSGPGVQP